MPLALPCPLLQPGVGSSVVTTSVEQPRLCFELRDRDVDAATISVSEAVGLGPAGRGHKVSFACSGQKSRMLFHKYYCHCRDRPEDGQAGGND